MLLRIRGEQYDLQEVLSRPTLNNLYYLKIKSRSEEYPEGMSLSKLGEYLKRMSTFDDPQQILDDPEILLALKGVVFLCMRSSGQKVTWDEAGEFGLQELDFVTEDSDELAVATAITDPPQAPSDSEAADADQPAGP